MIGRFAKRTVERLLGREVERFGDTIALINPSRRRDAWFSYQATIRAIFAELRITQVIDVGANTGQFASSLRQFYKGPIHSFEPVSGTYEALKARAAGDPSWTVHRMALGNETAERAIHISRSSDFNSLLKTNAYCVQRFGERSSAVTTELVPVRRLADVLGTLSPDPSRERFYLKLDTQGYDLEVFRGLADCAPFVAGLQSEVSLIPLYEAMPHWTDSLAAYESGGFRVVGLFPVSIDAGRVIELDCLLARG